MKEHRGEMYFMETPTSNGEEREAETSLRSFELYFDIYAMGKDIIEKSNDCMCSFGFLYDTSKSKILWYSANLGCYKMLQEEC